ncbi:hypothetical protein [Corallococcus sp. AB018]|uniref:hypothetical protein n=1 Tax=Corallococcus sp. AB018 TaxID=2316715 RepID=UPI000F861A22|nr:hypothetical protein [Corallococcus sp. AB018]
MRLKLRKINYTGQAADKNLIRGRANNAGDMLLETIEAIREEFPAGFLQGLASWMSKVPQIRTEALGITPVRTLKGLHRRRPFEEIPIERELLWSARILRLRMQALREHCGFVEVFSRSAMAGNLDAALAVLTESEKKLGYSLWAVENRIAALQGKGGMEKQKEYAHELIRKNKGSFAAFVAHHVSRRNEESIALPRFVSRLQQSLNRWKLDEELRNYIEYRVSGTIPNEPSKLADLLRHDATSSIVDWYETFIIVSARLLSMNPEGETLRALAESFSLLSVVGDARIRRMQFVVGDCESLPCGTGADLNAYWSGEYSDAIAAADAALQQTPTDLLAISIKAKSIARLDRAKEIGKAENLGEKVVVALTTLASGNEVFDRAHAELSKIARNFRAIPTMMAIGASINIGTAASHADVGEPRLMKFIFTSRTDPLDSSALPKTLREEYVRRLSEFGGSTLHLIATKVVLSLPVDASEVSRLAPERLAECEAMRSIDCKDYSRALEVGRGLGNSQAHAERIGGARIEIDCLLQLGKGAEALERIAYWCAQLEPLRWILPVERAMAGKNIKSMRPFLGQISTPILFELQYRSRENQDARNSLRWACDEFLNRNGIERPSDIARQAEQYPMAQVVYFLRRVCVPLVLESCRRLSTSRAVEEERLNVCSALVGLDPKNAESYLEEIKVLATKLKIEEGVQLVDRSRIFVDTDALARWAERELREDFDRYLSFIEAIPQSSKAFEVALREAITGSKPLPTRYLDIPNESNDALLLEMIEALRDEFLANPEHGLNCFLSMRIRHGTLSGTLRGPLDDHKLITTRSEETNSYRRNDYWVDRIKGATPEQREKVSAALTYLSVEYDRIVEERIKPLLYVRSEARPEGLFRLSIRPFYLHLIRRDAVETKSFDAFLSSCFHVFQSYLSAELEVARAAVESIFNMEVERVFQETFGRLGRTLTEWQYADLKGHLVEANTGAQGAIIRVVDWLHLSESETEQASFTMAQILEIAIESAQRILRGFTPRVTTIPEVDRKMGVSVLSEITDIVFIVLDNVYKHSGVKESPWVKISVRERDDASFVSIDVESEVAGGVRTEDAERSLSEIRGLIGGEGYRDRVASEGKSGLVKIKRIVSQHKSHVLDFSFKGEGCFAVHVGFSLLNVPSLGRSEALPVASVTE